MFRGAPGPTRPLASIATTRSSVEGIADEVEARRSGRRPSPNRASRFAAIPEYRLGNSGSVHSTPRDVGIPRLERQSMTPSWTRPAERLPPRSWSLCLLHELLASLSVRSLRASSRSAVASRRKTRIRRAATPAFSRRHVDPRFRRPNAFAAEHPDFGHLLVPGQGRAYALRAPSGAIRRDAHDGEAVMIFVTEDFLPKLQVKQEHGESRATGISVLKLNAYRRFYTGIYPYTLMTSSFTPADGRADAQAEQHDPGVVRSRLHARSIVANDGLHTLMHSYFQERRRSEDGPSRRDPWKTGLWAQLRIDPSKDARWASGVDQLIPRLDYIRLRHKALACRIRPR